MLSNSKLNMWEKDAYLEMYNNNPDVVFEHIGSTTIAYKIKGDFVEFATAICSPDEIKYRKKVGKYHAIYRFDNGETVKMLKSDFDFMLECLTDKFF